MNRCQAPSRVLSLLPETARTGKPPFSRSATMTMRMATSGSFSEAAFDSRASAVPGGHFPEFDSPTRSWPSLFGRLQFFAAHNNDAPEKKKAHLLPLCDKQTYEPVCALTQLKPPMNVSYRELVAALTTHFVPQSSEVCNRTLFQRQD